MANYLEPEEQTRRLSRDLRRYLIKDERKVVVVRQHWMSQRKPLAACFMALLAAAWMDVKAPPTAAGASAAQAFWALWLGTCFWLAWRVLNWRRDWFVATDKRFLLFYGLFHRRVAMMPLAKVTDLTFHRSILGRVLGYGDFRLESAGQQQALSQIDFIPDADEHYRAICQVLFGDDPAADASGGGYDDDWYDEDPPPGGGRGPRPYDAGPTPRHTDPSPSGPFADDPTFDRPAAADWDEHGREASLYRSEDLVKASRLGDTGEIPVVVARPEPVRKQRIPRRY